MDVAWFCTGRNRKTSRDRKSFWIFQWRRRLPNGCSLCRVWVCHLLTAQAQSHLWQVDDDRSLARLSLSVSVLQAEAGGGDAFCLVPRSLPCLIPDRWNCARENAISGASVSANAFELKASMKVCECSFWFSGHVVIGEMRLEEIHLLMQRKGSDHLVLLLRVISANLWVQPLWNDSLIADMQVECLV